MQTIPKLIAARALALTAGASARSTRPYTVEDRGNFYLQSAKSSTPAGR